MKTTNEKSGAKGDKKTGSKGSDNKSTKGTDSGRNTTKK
jgi:hypothetical protein